MEKYKERKQMSWQGWFYAVQRIDLLIISISGASVYVILETLKYSSTNHLSNLWVIKSSGVLFVLCIVVNFISQFTGKKANELDIRYCEANIEEKEQAIIQKYDCLSNVYTGWTNGLNLTSLIIMFVALAALITYFLVSF
jgi:hypothetical protein